VYYLSSLHVLFHIGPNILTLAYLNIFNKEYDNKNGEKLKIVIWVKSVEVLMQIVYFWNCVCSDMRSLIQIHDIDLCYGLLGCDIKWSGKLDTNILKSTASILTLPTQDYMVVITQDIKTWIFIGLTT
jgi:hypothetical protein